jgi:hypothetical protein
MDLEDGMVSRQEFDQYLEMLEEQRKLVMLYASNFTLNVSVWDFHKKKIILSIKYKKKFFLN